MFGCFVCAEFPSHSGLKDRIAADFENDTRHEFFARMDARHTGTLCHAPDESRFVTEREREREGESQVR